MSETELKARRELYARLSAGELDDLEMKLIIDEKVAVFRQLLREAQEQIGDLRRQLARSEAELRNARIRRELQIGVDDFTTRQMLKGEEFMNAG